MQLETLRRIAPELASVSDADALAWLEQAARQLASPREWGAVYADAVAYLAAHLMTRAQVGRPASPLDPGVAAPSGIGAVTTGRLSVTFGAPGGVGAGRSASGGDDDLTTTRYGLHFINLRSTRRPAIFTARRGLR